MGDTNAFSMNTGGRPNLGLVLQIISWSASRLHHLESVVNSTSRHLPSASKSSNSPSKLSSNGEAEQGIREKRTGQPMDKILHALTQLPVRTEYLNHSSNVVAILAFAVNFHHASV